DVYKRHLLFQINGIQNLVLFIILSYSVYHSSIIRQYN
ncbi:hypothetical protein A5874_000998, partial [Enterococcus faecium]